MRDEGIQIRINARRRNPLRNAHTNICVRLFADEDLRDEEMRDEESIDCSEYRLFGVTCVYPKSAHRCLL